MRPQPLPVEESQFLISCDSVIMAIGQLADAALLGLIASENGWVAVNSNLLARSNPGVFAAGDVVTGPSSIIESIALGRRAASSIDLYLGGDGIIDPDEKPSDEIAIPDPAPRGTTHPVLEKTSVDNRLSGFSLSEKGYDRRAAIFEARRCLACDLRDYTVEVNSRLCKGCGYCKEVCPQGLFQVSNSFNPSGYHPVSVEHSDCCVGCLNCLYICPDFAIKIKGNYSPLPISDSGISPARAI